MLAWNTIIFFQFWYTERLTDVYFKWHFKLRYIFPFVNKYFDCSSEVSREKNFCVIRLRNTLKALKKILVDLKGIWSLLLQLLYAHDLWGRRSSLCLFRSLSFPVHSYNPFIFRYLSSSLMLTSIYLVLASLSLAWGDYSPVGPGGLEAWIYSQAA